MRVKMRHRYIFVTAFSPDYQHYHFKHNITCNMIGVSNMKILKMKDESIVCISIFVEQLMVFEVQLFHETVFNNNYLLIY